MQDNLSKNSQNQKEIKNAFDQSLSSVHNLNSKDSSTHIESQSLDNKETLTLSQTSQTAKEIQDPSQNPNHQKVSKTSTDQSQAFSAKLNSTKFSTHKGSQSSNNKNLLTLSKNSLVPVKDTRHPMILQSMQPRMNLKPP